MPFPSMGKRKKPKPPSPPPEDPDEELTGFVHGGELLLRTPSGLVFSSERDERGALVAIGTWDAETDAVVALPAAAPAAAAEARSVPKAPHPPPDPLAFEAQEIDHCETAPVAYEHIAQILHAIAQYIGRGSNKLRIYDPYYCNGAVVRHLDALGFSKVYNRNEDFYAVQAADRGPRFDVLVTNPPYSDDHPYRMLRFCAKSGKPWLALMPNWVYSKPSFRPALEGGCGESFYLVPIKRYYYWTPKGRRRDITGDGAKKHTHGHTNAALGARTSPFVSFWYCGGFPKELAARIKPPEGMRMCRSIDELPQAVLAETDPRRLGGNKVRRKY